MSCRFCRDNFTAYLQGELKGARAVRFEAHLRSCPACARDLEDFRAAVEALRALPPVRPPADLLARIDAALDDTPVPLPAQAASPQRRWSWQHAGGFALAACVLVTFLAILRTGHLSTGGAPPVVPPVVSRVPDARPPAESAANTTRPASSTGRSQTAAVPEMTPSVSTAPQRGSGRAAVVTSRGSKAAVRAPRKMRMLAAAEPHPTPWAPPASAPEPVKSAAAPAMPEGAPEQVEPARAMATPFSAAALTAAGRGLQGERSLDVGVTKSLANDMMPAPAPAAPPAAEPVGMPPSGEIMRVDFVPPRTRQVGEIGVAALVMEPSRPIRRAEVRVEPQSEVAITNAGSDGVIFRGALPANRRTTVAVRMEPRKPGAHDMRIEVKTDVPAANTALEVHVAGFKPAMSAPATENPEPRSGVNLVLDQTDIRAALHEVAQKAGVRVDVDPKVGGQRVNYSFYDVPAEAALRVLADEGGYRVAPDDGGWRVTKP